MAYVYAVSQYVTILVLVVYSDWLQIYRVTHSYSSHLASFPPNAVEGLVKLLRGMTSGGRLEAWLCMQLTGSATPPDVHLTSFYIGVLPGLPPR